MDGYSMAKKARYQVEIAGDLLFQTYDRDEFLDYLEVHTEVNDLSEMVARVFVDGNEVVCLHDYQIMEYLQDAQGEIDIF